MIRLIIWGLLTILHTDCVDTSFAETRKAGCNQALCGHHNNAQSGKLLAFRSVVANAGMRQSPDSPMHGYFGCWDMQGMHDNLLCEAVVCIRVVVLYRPQSEFLGVHT